MMATRTFALFAALINFCTGAAFAQIVGFEAEDGTLGSNFTVFAEGDATDGDFVLPVDFLGDNAIVSTVNDSGGVPTSTNQVTTYSVTLDAGTYDLYARFAVAEGNSATQDSFFAGATFGSLSLDDASWITVNDLEPNNASGRITDVEGNNLAAGVMAWVRLTDYFPIGDPGETVPQFTSLGATETFQIANREQPFYIDAFAFVPDGLDSSLITSETLSASVTAVPEPSSYALLALGMLAAGCTHWRRKKRSG